MISYKKALEALKKNKINIKSEIILSKNSVNRICSQDIKSTNKVRKTLSKRYQSRNGGYTRIIKAGFRYGDNAPLAVIEFVDRDEDVKGQDSGPVIEKKETEEQEQ